MLTRKISKKKKKTIKIKGGLVPNRRKSGFMSLKYGDPKKSAPRKTLKLKIKPDVPRQTRKLPIKLLSPVIGTNFENNVGNSNIVENAYSPEILEANEIIKNASPSIHEVNSPEILAANEIKVANSPEILALDENIQISVEPKTSVTKKRKNKNKQNKTKKGLPKYKVIKKENVENKKNIYTICDDHEEQKLYKVNKSAFVYLNALETQLNDKIKTNRLNPDTDFVLILQDDDTKQQLDVNIKKDTNKTCRKLNGYIYEFILGELVLSKIQQEL